MISDPGNVPLSILIIIGLICINGFIVVSNTAFNSVNRNKIKNLIIENSNMSAKKVIGLIDKPYKYRFTNRLLNYVCIVGGMVYTIELPYSDLLSAIVFTLVAVPFSELLPRKIAQQHSEAIAMSFVHSQNFLDVIFMPIVKLLTLVTDLFLIIFRQKIKIEESGYSEEQVMSILEAGQQSGEIKEEGKKMINSIFQFDDELAYEIMTPRTDVFMIDINDPSSEYLDQLMELRYSRIPVCEDESDNIIGILHIKDYLIKARESGFDKVDINSILRKPYFVPETKNIDSLFFELQKEKQHIAILIDEYGGFSGIATMEDIIEEVMGDIDDEYDEEEHIITQVDKSTYLIDGNVDLDDLNEEIDGNLQSDNSETIGGFIIDILGEIPDDGVVEQKIKYENYEFEILSVKERRIEKIRLKINQLDDLEEVKE